MSGVSCAEKPYLSLLCSGGRDEGREGNNGDMLLKESEVSGISDRSIKGPDSLFEELKEWDICM